MSVLNPAKLLGFLLLGVLVCIPRLEAKFRNTEDWMEPHLQADTSAFQGDAPAVILFGEETYELDDTGGLIETRRYILRLLRNAGRDHTHAHLVYDSKTDKILSLKAWLFRDNYKTEKRHDKAWADLCGEDAMTLATETRSRTVAFVDKAVAGDVFAWETKVRRRLFHNQIRYKFGGLLPCRLEQLKISTSQGLELRTYAQGPGKLVEQGTGALHTWSLRETPYRPEESNEADEARVDCDLVVLVRPTPSNRDFKPLQFDTWDDVARWVQKMNQGKCDNTPEMQAKVAELTATATTPFEKIQILSAYVQALRYVANNEGLAQGLGFVARPASLVFKRGYGDCKDKSNLLKAMLALAGIKSHTIAIFAGNALHVREDIPSPAQFNHAILGIEADASVALPSIIHCKGVGRLLVFDPTDVYTHLGDLPRHLQGALAHVEEPGTDSLVRLPVLAPEDGAHLQRKATIELNKTGIITLDCEIEAKGSYASALRRRIARINTSQGLEKVALSLLGSSIHPAGLDTHHFTDEPKEGRMRVGIKTKAKDYLQGISGNMLIAKLDIFTRDNVPVFSERNRRLAMELPSLLCEDQIRIPLPDDLELVEAPKESHFEHEFGSLNITCQVNGREVMVTRTLTLRHQVLPIERYAELKQFLTGLARNDRSALLLRVLSKTASQKRETPGACVLAQSL